MKKIRISEHEDGFAIELNREELSPEQIEIIQEVMPEVLQYFKEVMMPKAIAHFAKDRFNLDDQVEKLVAKLVSRCNKLYYLNLLFFGVIVLLSLMLLWR